MITREITCNGHVRCIRLMACIPLYPCNSRRDAIVKCPSSLCSDARDMHVVIISCHGNCYCSLIEIDQCSLLMLLWTEGNIGGDFISRFSFKPMKKKLKYCFTYVTFSSIQCMYISISSINRQSIAFDNKQMYVYRWDIAICKWTKRKCKLY